jgi:cyclophilin family peptidyl-prolyl cis-trans isomerase
MFSKIFENSFKYSEAVILTNKGEFRFEFFNEITPISVGNFCYLAEKKYFNGNKFHRVVPNFVIQTGDSTSTGWGGPGYDIISEFNWLPFETGYVGMASAGKDTEGSQWFVMHNYYPHLNNNYTVFGRLVKGQKTVDIIDENDVVFEVRLIQK